MTSCLFSRVARLVALLLLVALTLASNSWAQSPLPPAAQAVIDSPEYKHTLWGILVVDAKTGDVLHDVNGDKLFTPASVTKLFSVAAALDELGADYRFKTPVVRHGDIDAKGVLSGDLILVSCGDLSFGGRTLSDGRIAFANNDHTYANGNEKGELTLPNPTAGLDAIARQVAEAGIKRVSGDVLVDDRLFEQTGSTGSGPAIVSPILVNDNLIDLMIVPGQLGERAKVNVRPASAQIRVDSRIVTADAGKPFRAEIRMTPPYDLVLTGQIAADSKPILRVAEVGSAAHFARTLFIEALERAKIQVDISPLSAPKTLALLREDVLKLPVVTSLESPPFGESARLILKVSHNLHASTLPMLLAAKRGKTTLKDGLEIQHDVLARLGVDVESISFGGGAGGSQADCVTPKATVQLLRAMQKHPAAAAYFDALPILGVDGTLSESVPSTSPARGRVFAKTGTYYFENTMNKRFLLTSKALAGYIRTARDRELAFAMFLNRSHIEKTGDTANAGKALGKIAEALYLAH